MGDGSRLPAPRHLRAAARTTAVGVAGAAARGEPGPLPGAVHPRVLPGARPLRLSQRRPAAPRTPRAAAGRRRGARRAAAERAFRPLAVALVLPADDTAAQCGAAVAPGSLPAPVRRAGPHRLAARRATGARAASGRRPHPAARTRQDRRRHARLPRPRPGPDRPAGGRAGDRPAPGRGPPRGGRGAARGGGRGHRAAAGDHRRTAHRRRGAAPDTVRRERAGARRGRTVRGHDGHAGAGARSRTGRHRGRRGGSPRTPKPRRMPGTSGAVGCPP